MKKFSKKGYIAYHSKKVDELINEGKINLAKRITLELIDEFPDDREIKIQLSRLCIIEKDYEKALNILEQLEEKYVFIKKTALYIKLNKEEKLYSIYQKYFCNEEYIKEYISDKKYHFLKMYLNKKYNPTNLSIKNDATYTEKQYYSYSKEKAISHIIKEHCLNKESGKSIFSENINIKNLYEQVTEYINNNPNTGELTQDIIEEFYFYYPLCGKINGNIDSNLLYVCTILGTREILSMYPVSKRKNIEYLYLEEKPTSKKKVKTKTGLERFNARYNQ